MHLGPWPRAAPRSALAVRLRGPLGKLHHIFGKKKREVRMLAGQVLCQSRPMRSETSDLYSFFNDKCHADVIGQVYASTKSDIICVTVRRFDGLLSRLQPYAINYMYGVNILKISFPDGSTTAVYYDTFYCISTIWLAFMRQNSLYYHADFYAFMRNWNVSKTTECTNMQNYKKYPKQNTCYISEVWQVSI